MLQQTRLVNLSSVARTPTSRPDCTSCSVAHLCLPAGMLAQTTAQFSSLLLTRRRVERGMYLYRAGDAFENLFAIWRGQFKVMQTSVQGRPHVSSFAMSGEIVGVDGIGDEVHECGVVALEDSEVCVIPYGSLVDDERVPVDVRQRVLQVLSREIVRRQADILSLGQLPADARVARFVADQAAKLGQRGYSSRQLLLRMSRAEMGSHLGLTIETVSRAISRLAAQGIIEVDLRDVTIVDSKRLATAASG